MSLFKFEIQSCISIEVEAENKIEARKTLVGDSSLYKDELAGFRCWINEGEEVRE